jgi:hypothetical protein
MENNLLADICVDMVIEKFHSTYRNHADFIYYRFILPILAEYSDSGYREPEGRIKYSLRENARYQALVLGSGLIGLVYVFISSGVSFISLKALIMALAYCWGLILAIYLMGHGLVAIPRRLIRDASISGRLRRIQYKAPKVHEKMEESIQKLEDLEAEVAQLNARKTGTARDFRDWIEDLADASNLPESRPRTLSRRLSQPNINTPTVITERYLADLTRKLDRARHSRVRFIDEWDRLLQQAIDVQRILDSAASKRIDLGDASPHSSFYERLTIFTPYTRYLYYTFAIPAANILFGVLFGLASVCIVWSEIIKLIKPEWSIIGLTVVHHPNSSQGQIGFAGQVIAACWILYMCVAALTSLTEVKVWRGRALVRRNTAYESAFWYAMQVAKLSVPLSYNFMTFLTRDIYKSTTFYQFLGKLIDFTTLGKEFDYFFPIFILFPVCATLFNLYGKVKRLIGFGVIDDEDEENETGYGTGGWREGRDLIERELQGHSSLAQLGHGRTDRHIVPNNPNNRIAPTISIPPAQRARPDPVTPTRPNADPHQGIAPEDENFFEAFGHRVRNTFDTVSPPRWLKEVGDGIKRPKWMGGDDDEPSGSGNGFTRLFAGSQSQGGRVRL